MQSVQSPYNLLCIFICIVNIVHILLIMFSSLPQPIHCTQSFCLGCWVSCITAPLFLCVSGRGIFQSYHYFQYRLYVHSRNACSRQFNLIYGLNRTPNVKMSVNHPRKYARVSHLSRKRPAYFHPPG